MEWRMLERRSHGHVPLIGHPYDDSSTAYLSTAILTILCFLHRFETTSEQEYTLNRPPPCETDTDQWLTSQPQNSKVSFRRDKFCVDKGVLSPNPSAKHVRLCSSPESRKYLHHKLMLKGINGILSPNTNE